MAVNMSVIDRLLRAALAAILAVAGVVAGAWPLLVLATLIALTAAFGRCPLYALYNISTVGGLHRTCDDDATCALPGTPKR